jgi:hypothetical protein
VTKRNHFQKTRSCPSTTRKDGQCSTFIQTASTSTTTMAPHLGICTTISTCCLFRGSTWAGYTMDGYLTTLTGLMPSSLSRAQAGLHGRAGSLVLREDRVEADLRSQAADRDPQSHHGRQDGVRAVQKRSFQTTNRCCDMAVPTCWHCRPRDLGG